MSRSCGGPDYATEVVGLDTYQNAFQYYHFGYASAIAVITFIRLPKRSLPTARPPANGLPMSAWPPCAEGTPDTGLCALYFHYGRYLLIASSRPGTQPANLQGIWNHQIQPPWSSNWTVNINTQMNYWPAETTNLADCHSSWTTWSKTPAKSWSPVRRPHRKTCSPWPAASRPESARRPPWTSG